MHVEVPVTERIKYFLATKKTSLGEARNLALKKATGKYIAFLDCDDLYFPEKIFNRLLETLNPEKVQVLKAVVESSIPKRSGYLINEFKIRGIMDEEV